MALSPKIPSTLIPSPIMNITAYINRVNLLSSLEEAEEPQACPQYRGPFGRPMMVPVHSGALAEPVWSTSNTPPSPGSKNSNPKRIVFSVSPGISAVIRTASRLTFLILTLRTSPLKRNCNGSCATMSAPITVFFPAFQTQTVLDISLGTGVPRYRTSTSAGNTASLSPIIGTSRDCQAMMPEIRERQYKSRASVKPAVPTSVPTQP